MLTVLLDFFLHVLLLLLLLPDTTIRFLDLLLFFPIIRIGAPPSVNAFLEIKLLDHDYHPTQQL